MGGTGKQSFMHPPPGGGPLPTHSVKYTAHTIFHKATYQVCQLLWSMASRVVLPQKNLLFNWGEAHAQA